jgi:hypothetical protein
MLAMIYPTMFRKLVAVFIALILCCTTVACSSSTPTQSRQTVNPQIALNQAPLSNGQYPVQQATYNDADGTYSLMLLNTPPGTPPVFNATKLQMARLTDEQIAKGTKTYLEIDGERAVMYLTEDFKIEYVHNVTETQTNQQTGQPETVVVRQESSFWTPFAGALAGQALGSLLFRPQYYIPPLYQPGGVITGYGGYGTNYGQAVDRYQTQYKTAPPAVKNRQTLRTTGRINSPASGKATRQPSSNSSKSTGSGYGSSKLRSSQSGYKQSRPRSSFGSGSGFGSRSRSYGGGRRRR